MVTSTAYGQLLWAEWVFLAKAANPMHAHMHAFAGLD